ncbi:hypothetical protein PGT21_022685 [Puccinia graminis f. sp. tritici]|uniref:Uncharacterized protein n=1 Tax=Puccinia graminis f. sp. tritici TaxID=56615 RepID=A0A5B0NB26_PUCGR|nr:hypothetical protein PGT21_022685 [Puccinia graminis f. sp. tritici]KAA1113728.1 hypothetical protein PGTUg99_004278 [Puccinia graminis f. sp. tritici]
MESSGKVTRSKSGGRKEAEAPPAIDPTHVAQPRVDPTNDPVVIDETPDSEGGEDVSLDLIVKNPTLSATVIEDVISKTGPPPEAVKVDKRAMVWDRLNAAQTAGDTFLSKILLAAYNSLEPNPVSKPVITRSTSAFAALSPPDRDVSLKGSPQAVDPNLAETQIEDNLVYAVGTVTSHQDIGFTPYFDENIKKLRAPLPLTIFDREWQKKALNAHLLLKPAKSSEDKAYRGLAFNDEWTQSHSDWTNNHRSFFITLRDVYNKKIFAGKLLKHKENCDSIADTYGFMTAFRYDMQIRMNAFTHRVPSKDGAALPDIAVKQGIVIEQCYSTVRSFGESNWKDNLYAPGQSHAAYDPDTGTKRPELMKASSFPSARGPSNQSGSGGYHPDNHQGRRRDTRRFGRGNGPDQWGNFNYGFHTQGYDGSNYGHNQQYGSQPPSFNNQYRHQFNGNFGHGAASGSGSFGHGAASGSGQGGVDSRKRFRPSHGQGDNEFNAGNKKGSGTDALTKP